MALIKHDNTNDTGMTFKQFSRWCNERACDGHWGMYEVMGCIDICARVRKLPFWKREKVWKEQYRDSVVSEIVNPTEKKIAEFEKERDNDSN